MSLAHVVQSMQRSRHNAPAILWELTAFFRRYPSHCETSAVNDVLESLGKRLDLELTEKVVEMLPSIDMAADQRT